MGNTPTERLRGETKPPGPELGTGRPDESTQEHIAQSQQKQSRANAALGFTRWVIAGTRGALGRSRDLLRRTRPGGPR